MKITVNDLDKVFKLDLILTFVVGAISGVVEAVSGKVIGTAEFPIVLNFLCFCIGLTFFACIFGFTYNIVYANYQLHVKNGDIDSARKVRSFFLLFFLLSGVIAFYFPKFAKKFSITVNKK